MPGIALIFGVLAFLYTLYVAPVKDQIPSNWSERVTRAAQQAAQRARDEDCCGTYNVFSNYRTYRVEDYRSRPLSLTLCDNSTGGPSWGQLEVFAFKIHDRGILAHTWDRWICVPVEH